MRAKEYLLKLKILDLSINQKLQEISDLRASLTCIQGINTSEEKVMSNNADSDARFVNTIIKIQTLEGEANVEIDKFVSEKHKIINQIHCLDNEKYIEILHKKYVEFKSLEQVAVEMNYTYQYIVLLHGYALKEFQNKFLYIFNV